MRTCSAKIIPALWFSLLALAALTASGSPQTRSGSKRASRAAAKPLPSTLAGMVRVLRDTPSAPHRAAVESYAAAHPKEAPLAHLALGVAAYETRDYADAIADLRKAQNKLAPIGDYTAYFLASARVESRDFDGIAESLRPVYSGEVTSPFAGRSWILQARAMKDASAGDAVKLLRDHHSELPQPDGDVALADSYLAAGDQPHAIEIYQRVAAQYLTGEAAAHATAALFSLKESMGAAYPPPSPQLLLHHADRLLETRSLHQARAEYHDLAVELTGPERDQARVRIGEVELLDGRIATAYPYLRELELPESEADAERLAYLVEATRHLTDDDEMKSALDRMAEHYPHSPWRLKALLSAANRFLLVNRPDEFVPLYRAIYQDFPHAPDAALAHWKVTFQAYLHDDPQAQQMLMDHARDYPNHPTAGAALYFLGRGFERQGDPGSALACYRRLISAWENHYYSMLARERHPADVAPRMPIGEFLSVLTLPAASPLPQAPSHLTELRIERSRLLRAAGLSDLADSELRFGARNGGQSALLGMEMAGAADAPHTAMHIMKGMSPEYLSLPFNAAPRKYWETLFPLPYRTDLEHSAHQDGLDPFLMAGLIRQESEFDPAALSPAKAYGLMQVRPGTGREVARKAGVGRFTNRMLFQPAVNLKLGAAILRGMLDENSDKLEETLASYNAGPAQLVKWLSWNQYREPAEFVESIPFTETRDYVQAVLRNADVYRRLYH
ncbi:MAG TPA: transglycosylase SLT domain-containing protein [Bryobacteraceae bacterium]|nr:transglycosylase SLT domain-containing protein [Bryobacteraceae bacterium]